MPADLALFLGQVLGLIACAYLVGKLVYQGIQTIQHGLEVSPGNAVEGPTGKIVGSLLILAGVVLAGGMIYFAYAWWFSGPAH